MHEINNIMGRRSNKSNEVQLNRKVEIDLSSNSGITPERAARFEKDQKKKAASGFEAMLLQQVFKSMWSGIDKSTLFGEESNESQIYRDLMIQAVSDETAKGKGVGIKAYLQKELDRLDRVENQNREVSSESVGSKVIFSNAKDRGMVDEDR